MTTPTTNNRSPQPPPIGPKHLTTFLVAVVTALITSIGTNYGTSLLTKSNERIATLETTTQQLVEAAKSKSAEKIEFGKLSHEQMAKEVMPRAQRFIETAMTIVTDTQSKFESLLEFSTEGKYDATATADELGKLLALRNGVDSLWSNVVDPGTGKALQEYNNYVGKQLGALPDMPLPAERKEAIVAESRRLKDEFRSAATKALSRLHGMGLDAVATQ